MYFISTSDEVNKSTSQPDQPNQPALAPLDSHVVFVESSMALSGPLGFLTGTAMADLPGTIQWR